MNMPTSDTLIVLAWSFNVTDSNTIVQTGILCLIATILLSFFFYRVGLLVLFKAESQQV